MEENLTRRAKIISFKQKNNTEKNTMKQGVWFLKKTKQMDCQKYYPKIKNINWCKI